MPETMNDPAIDEIPGSDSELAALLAQAGLPTDDLDLSGRQFFRFRDGGALVGFIGWEAVNDTHALLRSFVVVPHRRDQGLGLEIARWALTRLAELGFTDAWILTTTAEALALRLGFARADRETAPAAIRQSRQFAGLCPASATLLHRSLP
ncbi:MAG: arsenic resistance N-acetyltransferase ArsN2 [Magnetospirillum sp.]|nr:arsenic resistance N-acetyltransferase ArsN2 [Magnetospirillum sp.]MCR6632460.1 arsenic resistance N-acetyltransferase ArsN2 [Magnetospirillum sp.]